MASPAFAGHARSALNQNCPKKPLPTHHVQLLFRPFSSKLSTQPGVDIIDVFQCEVADSFNFLKQLVACCTVRLLLNACLCDLNNWMHVREILLRHNYHL
jgi:hypothetical protein